MKMPDIQLLSQAALYLFIMITGFAVSVPLGVTMIDIDGHCLLYADINWENHKFVSSSPPNCNFIIYYNVFGCIIFPFAMFIYFGYAICHKDPNISSKMWVIPFIFLGAIKLVVSFVTSCMISVGFKQVCDGFTEGKSYSCSEISKYLKFIDKDYDSEHFYAFLNVAQIASWTGFLCLGVQFGLFILRLVRNRRSRSQASEVYNDSVNSDSKKIGELEPTA